MSYPRGARMYRSQYSRSSLNRSRAKKTIGRRLDKGIFPIHPTLLLLVVSRFVPVRRHKLQFGSPLPPFQGWRRTRQTYPFCSGWITCEIARLVRPQRQNIARPFPASRKRSGIDRIKPLNEEEASGVCPTNLRIQRSFPIPALSIGRAVANEINSPLHVHARRPRFGAFFSLVRTAILMSVELGRLYLSKVFV